jgi:hypothetical protein
MPTPPTTNLRRTRSVVALALRILAVTGCAHAMAQPPAATAVLATSSVGQSATPPRSAQATTPTRHALLKPARLPPPPSALERLGGEHARRAMRVAQGVPAGRIALRPMFWMTRDRGGAVIALGGRF